MDAGCWGSMIEAKAGHYFDHDFRGFDGYNTRWALELVTQLFPRFYLDKVEVLTIFFGHNDSWENQPLGVSPEEFEHNYREIVRYFRDHEVGPERMILITPTWYHYVSFQEFLKKIQAPPAGKSLEHATRYHEAVLRIGKENGIQVVDMFNASKNFDPLEELFCDGVHYSRKGANMLFDLLFPVIQKKLEEKYQMPLDRIRHADQWMEKPEMLQAFVDHKIRMQNVDDRN